ncbi:unnamed protein product [Trichobilharzia szidati]|nr:unnamed protein product [Trichobilharzia szidati]
MAAAAAVAASGAAGVGNSAPSPVAAMLGNLIGCNEKDIVHAVQSSSTLSSASASSSSSSSAAAAASFSYAGASLLPNSSRHNNCSVSNKCDSDATTVISRCPQQQQQQQQQQISTVDEKSSNDDHQNEHGGSGGGGVGVSNNSNNNNNNSMDQNNVQSNTVNTSSSSSDRCKCTNTLLDNNPHSLQDAITSDSSNWSSVITTIASAAKAAAAAAVAATAAVTGVANFFRLTKLKNKVDPQLQSGSSLSSSSSSGTPASSSSTSSPSLRCIDQCRNLRLSTTTDQMSSSVIVHDDDDDDEDEDEDDDEEEEEEETELSGCLSTEEAVTMTSAAAAAAATVAAEQHQLFENNFLSEMNRPIDPLTASIANASVSPGMQNISQPSSAFEVCHFPVVSIANVFPKLSQDVTSENAKLNPVGVPNTVTLLLGQSTTPQTSTYAIPASVASHPSVPMQIPVSVGTHLTPTVSCPPHRGGPAKLVVSVAYPNQAAAAAAASVRPTTSNQYIASNPVNNSNNTQTPHLMPNNHQIQIVHKFTDPKQITRKK